MMDQARPRRIPMPSRLGRLRLAGLSILLAAGFFVLVASSLGQPGPLAAGAGVWTQMDLANMQITSVAVDPTNPNIVFAGASGQGVFRSVDAGRTWVQTNSGIGNLFVNDLLVSPADPAIILAATGRGPLVGDPQAGVYRSTDRGATWTNRLAGFVGGLDVSPQNSQLLYAAGAPPVFRSSNGGVDWVQAFTDVTVFQNVDMRAVAISPADGNIVLVGGTSEGGTGTVFRTTNGGQSWGRVQDFAVPAVSSIAFSSSNGQLAFFGSGQGTWRSRDAGTTWNLAMAGPAALSLLADPLNGNTVYVGTSGQGVLQTTNRGDSFLAMNAGLGNLVVRGSAVDRSQPQTVWAGTDNGLWAFTFPVPSPTPTPTPVTATLSITPTSGAPGTAVRYTGAGFTPAGRASVLLVRGVGIAVDTPIANQAGVISGTFAMPNPATVPQVAFGPVEVFAVDATSGRETPPVSFTLARPAPASTWFFAEGSTAPPFDTWYLVQNPTDNPARVRFTFFLEDGSTPVSEFTVGARSRFSLFANQVVPGRALSARIDADQQVFAERSMFVSFDGHVVAGIPGPNTTWLFAEGSTQQPFHTWLLLQNPNAAGATATITYLVQGGLPQAQTISLPPTSRRSIFVNQVLPGVAFSVQVRSDSPIIVERSMFRFPGNAATGVAGVNQPSQSWFFAQGDTNTQGLPTDTFLLLQNPNAQAVPVTVTLFLEAGAPVPLALSLPPSSRQTIFLNQFVQGSFGIRVEAGAGIIAERSMFFGPEPRGATATVGSPVLATRWHLAEGSTAPPFNEVIAIMNPNAQDAAATIEFELPTGSALTRGFTVLAQSKLSILVDAIVPNEAVSAVVNTSLPTVVERTMFFDKLGSTGGAGKIGIR